MKANRDGLAMVGFLAFMDEYIKKNLDIEQAWETITNKIVDEYIANVGNCETCYAPRMDCHDCRNEFEYRPSKYSPKNI